MIGASFNNITGTPPSFQIYYIFMLDRKFMSSFNDTIMKPGYYVFYRQPDLV